MSVAKIIEITAESPESFDAAINEGIARAAKTVHNIESACVKDQLMVIEGGKIKKYRVDLKVKFILD